MLGDNTTIMVAGSGALIPAGMRRLLAYVIKNLQLQNPNAPVTLDWLVTALGNSPENAFQMANGKTAHVAMGPTIDQQLLRYLFDACIEASKLLNADAEFRKELSDKRARLAPTRVGSDGRVMEWLEEYAEPEPTLCDTALH